MTRQKHNVFLDLTTVKTTVDLSSDLHDRRIVGATLVHWNVEGMKDQGGAYQSDYFYIQAKFTGSLESQSITYGARPDMIQLPCRQFNGWGISPHPMNVSFRVQPFCRRFEVEFYHEGSGPSTFVIPTDPDTSAPATFRVMMWLEIETEQL